MINCFAFFIFIRMEYLLSVHPEEAALQLSQEELAGILETLRAKKLVHVNLGFHSFQTNSRKSRIFLQRFSRLAKLLNTMSARLYEMSPIDSDDGRIFCPGSLSNVTLNREWLKAQIRSLCFVQGNRNKYLVYLKPHSTSFFK